MTIQACSNSSRDDVICRIKVSYAADPEVHCAVWVGAKALDNYSSKEILQKLKSSNLAFMHDSASNAPMIFGPGGHYLQELMFTPDELKQISPELGRVQTKIKKISKAHKTALAELLGHLEEKYDVEFAIPEGMFSGSIPFAVNLRDKNVDVSLSDWGSGTKNRTQIMMSILQATQIRSKPDENKIIPFIIIEEPESFLHPSAQAEFGRVLIELANELRIQTIVTTHSPYMLSQQDISSNILLERKVSYGKLKQSQVVDVEKDKWMQPFSTILGLDNAEFAAWKEALFTTNHCVLLVEGSLDKAYFEHIHSLRLRGMSLPDGIEIVAYEGKDALKNAILVKFIIQKFKRVLVTFDLDAKCDLQKTMSQIGLSEGSDYLTLGVSKPGKDCIEGLVPERILAKVYGANTDLVMQLGGSDPKARKAAKRSLKQKILAEFRSDGAVTADDVKGFHPVFRTLNKLASDANGTPVG